MKFPLPVFFTIVGYVLVFFALALVLICIAERIRVWFAVRRRHSWIPSAPKPMPPLPDPVIREWFAAGRRTHVPAGPSRLDADLVVAEAIRACREHANHT